MNPFLRLAAAAAAEARRTLIGSQGAGRITTQIRHRLPSSSSAITARTTVNQRASSSSMMSPRIISQIGHRLPSSASAITARTIVDINNRIRRHLSYSTDAGVGGSPPPGFLTPTPPPAPTEALTPTLTPAPGSKPTPEPTPAPGPQPTPEPTPALGPQPTPALGPQPTPAPEPQPQPQPQPDPDLDPDPTVHFGHAMRTYRYFRTSSGYAKAIKVLIGALLVVVLILAGIFNGFSVVVPVTKRRLWFLLPAPLELLMSYDLREYIMKQLETDGSSLVNEHDACFVRADTILKSLTKTLPGLVYETKVSVSAMTDEEKRRAAIEEMGGEGQKLAAEKVSVSAMMDEEKRRVVVEEMGGEGQKSAAETDEEKRRVSVEEMGGEGQKSAAEKVSMSATTDEEKRRLPVEEMGGEGQKSAAGQKRDKRKRMKKKEHALLRGLCWRLTVARNSLPYAFGFMGGHMVVFTGALDRFSDVELAALLSRQIASVVARHLYKQNVGAWIYRKSGYLSMFSSIAVELLFIQPGIEFEDEIDMLGLSIATAAGYNRKEVLQVYKALPSHLGLHMSDGYEAKLDGLIAQV